MNDPHEEEEDYEFTVFDDEEPLPRDDEIPFVTKREGDHPIDAACEVVVGSLGGIAWFIGALTGGLSRE